MSGRPGSAQARGGLPGRVAPRHVVPALLGLCLPAIHLLAAGPLPWNLRLMGAVPGALAATLGARYLLNRRFDRLPFLEYSLAQIYIFWGSGAINPDVVQRLPVSDDGLTLALLAVLLFCAVFLASFPLAARLGGRLRGPISRLLPSALGPAADMLFWPWLGLAMAGNSGVLNRLPAGLHLPLYILTSHIPLQAHAALRGLGRNRQAWMLPLCTMAVALAGMLSGRMRSVLIPLLISGVLTLILRRRLPWRWAGILLLLFVVLQPAKHAYRAIAWSGSDHRHSTDVELTASRWNEAFSQTWSAGGDWEENGDNIALRLNNLSSVGLVFDMVPGIIPHVRFHFWRLLLIAPLPRLLYPDKPNFTEAINNHYSLTFGIQDERFINRTTVVFPLISDGYWSFGWPGVAAAALALGLVVGVYSRCFDLARWGSLATGLTIFSELRSITHLVEILGGVMQRFTGLAGLCWLLWLLSHGATRPALPARAPAPRRRQTATP